MIVGQSVRSGSRIWSITPSSMPATRLTSASETGRLGSRSEITFGLHPRRVLAFGSRAALPWRVEVARVLRRGRLRSSALSSVMPQDSDRTADPLSNLSYCDRIGTPVNLRCPPQSAKGRFAAQTKGIPPPRTLEMPRPAGPGRALNIRPRGPGNPSVDARGILRQLRSVSQVPVSCNGYVCARAWLVARRGLGRGELEPLPGMSTLSVRTGTYVIRLQ